MSSPFVTRLPSIIDFVFFQPSQNLPSRGHRQVPLAAGRFVASQLTAIPQSAAMLLAAPGQSEYRLVMVWNTSPAADSVPGTPRVRPSTTSRSLPVSPNASAFLSPFTPRPPKPSSETRTSTSLLTRLGKSSETSMPRVSRSWHSPATTPALPTPRNGESSLQVITGGGTRRPSLANMRCAGRHQV